MKIVIGKGLTNPNIFSGTWPREAELAEDMRDMTFQDIGEQLARQYGLTDGIVELVEINFVIKKNPKEENPNGRQ